MKDNKIKPGLITTMLLLCHGQVFSAACGDVNYSGAIDIVDASQRGALESGKNHLGGEQCTKGSTQSLTHDGGGDTQAVAQMDTIREINGQGTVQVEEQPKPQHNGEPRLAVCIRDIAAFVHAFSFITVWQIRLSATTIKKRQLNSGRTCWV